MIKHIHSSGRFDRSPEKVSRAMKRYARAANLITLTEMHDAERAKALHRPGFKVVKFDGPGAGDPAVVVSTDEWEVLEKWSKQLTKYEQRRGPGGPKPPHSLTVLLRHRRTGKRLLVSVVHMPSHVEGDWFAKFYWRVFVWKDAHKTWKNHVYRLRSSHNAKVLMVADWNINFKRKVFRTVMRRLHPDLKLTWRPPFPKDGTHFKRIIDGSVTDLRIESKARLFEDDDSSDHRPYKECLSW